MTDRFTLVRDGIPQKIRNSAQKPRMRVVSEKEFPLHLRNKLYEEVCTLCSTSIREYIIRALADIKEVFDMLLVYEKFGYAHLEHKKYEPRTFDVSYIHDTRFMLRDWARHIKSLSVSEDKKEPYAIFWKLYRETLGVYYISLTEAEHMRARRRAELGGFDGRIFLESVSNCGGAAQ